MLHEFAASSLVLPAGGAKQQSDRNEQMPELISSLDDLMRFFNSSATYARHIPSM